ncbi:class B acid phosphatase [Hafnia alvei]|uniref:acid phosphatase AphA n=1 Tax=Hafnia alvei TaxID=569 RepID=UPI00061CF0EB|nr:acid phosphatase AphA [Hafnia alvei]KID01095.2 acid phosphatase [Hafnia alvei]MBW3477474.1 acid phosphatase AphA [Hafnia alvei]MDU3156228.1 acid phosphatase AphA [Hafnia alvei]TBL47354.1 class B acid phosphatase [Hafnia alvei]TBM18310.1 class B acid phosphatase [Hafnia alvei]
MRKIAAALSALALVISLSPSTQAKVSTDTPLNAGVTVAQLAHQAPIHWVSVTQIENSLQGIPPIAVGFDIDDTVLFSSPGFYRGQKEFSPQDQSYLKDPAFWEKMNNGWDSFSMPKQVGKDLIAMHLKRGDSIYFITGRSPTKTETVTNTLQEDFSIPAASMNSVIFAGDQPGQNTKINWIKEKQIKVYYGDSDGDITAARDVGIRGIRVLRASNSSYQPLPKAGALGEEVIVNSEY